MKTWKWITLGASLVVVILLVLFLFAYYSTSGILYDCGEKYLFQENLGSNMEEALRALDLREDRAVLTLWENSSIEEVKNEHGEHVKKELRMVVFNVVLDNGSLAVSHHGSAFLDNDGNLYLRPYCK